MKKIKWNRLQVTFRKETFYVEYRIFSTKEVVLVFDGRYCYVPQKMSFPAKCALDDLMSKKDFWGIQKKVLTDKKSCSNI